ncbi:hypothetical protein [Streptomyces graminilatus]|uniref:hypothetical protein n=1 Tax=Streptomyces graminilatus TaxID=1464070 RepID=UPI0006E3FB61|nr:hypothetical protein [Streptomyces graminilatus]
MPNAEVDAPLDDAALQERQAACRAVGTAFRDSGVNAMPKAGTTLGSAAVTVTIPLDWPDVERFLIGRGLPSPDAAAPLRHLLEQHGVDAQVAVVEFGPGTALKVELDTGDDAVRLAAFVIDRRSDAHSAALRLKAAFTGIGISAERIFVADGAVLVGGIDIQDALTLYAVLDGGHGEEIDELDLEDRWDPEGWRDVETLAELLGPVVSKASGGLLASTPNPACQSCISSRPHRITLGRASPGQAVLLADAIAASDAPGAASGAGPPAV